MFGVVQIGMASRESFSYDADIYCSRDDPYLIDVGASDGGPSMSTSRQ